MTLKREKGVGVLPKFVVDAAFHLVRAPKGLIVVYCRHPFVIFVAELLPQCASRLHAEVPGYVVEPEQIFFRTTVDVVVH